MAKVCNIAMAIHASMYIVQTASALSVHTLKAGTLIGKYKECENWNKKYAWYIYAGQI